MGCLIGEIAALIFGIISLVTGKFTLSRNKVVRGAPARVVGLLLVLILPVALGLAVVVAAMLMAQGRLPDPAHPPVIIYAVEPVVFVIFFSAAIIVAAIYGGPPQPVYIRFEEEEDEDFEDRRERYRRPSDDELRP
jgi:hypothetical protein